MCFLIVFPINDRDLRITPFFNSIKSALDLDQFEILFIIEESNEESIRVLNYEIDISDHDFNIINPQKPIGRGESHSIASEYAKSRKVDYFSFFNEGWEDTAEEFYNIFQTREYRLFDLYIGCRHVYERSLGTLINIASNMLFSLRFSRLILETKADSINIFKTDFFIDHGNSININKHFVPALMVKTSKKKLAFTVVDNGLNYPSQVKLNISYLFNNLLFIFFKVQR